MIEPITPFTTVLFLAIAILCAVCCAGVTIRTILERRRQRKEIKEMRKKRH